MSGVATGQVVRFQVFADPELVNNTFTVIEIWRSRDTDAGPYEEITAAQWDVAALFAPSRPYSLSGETLKLLVNEQHEVSILFAGTDPLSASSIATQVQDQGLGLVRSRVADDLIYFETAQPGGLATLRVLEGDAATLLTLPTVEPLSVAFGKDVRIPLVPGTQLYVATDQHGSADFFYKMRFRNASTGAVSEFSSPTTVATGGVEPTALVRGFAKLVDLTGRPLENHQVSVHNKFKGVVVGDTTVAGGSVSKVTDAQGTAEFFLMRGLVVTVSVAGTNLTREVTVPTDPAIESFNLLGGAVGPDDVFKVQIPNIAYAERRSL